MVADAVSERRIFAAGTWDKPMKEMAAHCRGEYAAPYQYIAQQKKRGGRPIRPSKISVTSLKNAARISVSACALAALVKHVEGRSWRAALSSDVKA